MNIFGWLLSEFGLASGLFRSGGTKVNPASGLPMAEGSAVDVAGNPIGTDLTRQQVGLPMEDIGHEHAASAQWVSHGDSPLDW